MCEIRLKITNRVGLHARPAALFVQTANRFKSDIQVCNGNGTVANAKSILGVLALGIKQGSEITIRAMGEDGEQAIAALSRLTADNFQGSQY